MNLLSSNEIDALRATLLREKTTLEKQLSEHGRKVAGDWQGTPAGFAPGEADTIDTANRMEELVTNVSLVEELERRHTEVREALTRMDAGTYGTDENTGEPISLERLQANPAARVNIS